MATLIESSREQKITDVQKQSDGRLLVTVETTITHTVTMAANEWSHTKPNGKIKAVDKAAMKGVVKNAIKGAKL